MPSPAQIREQRIKELLKYATNHNITLIDQIISKALELYPTTSYKTIKSYAEAVMRILKVKGK